MAENIFGRWSPLIFDRSDYTNYMRASRLLPSNYSSLVLGVFLAGCGGAVSPDSGATASRGFFQPTPYMQSVDHVKALAQGMAAYASDDDDIYPLADWMAATAPYVRDATAYHSPAVPAPGYGYAFSSDLVGKNLHSVADPEKTHLIFDSTNVAFNAVALPSSEPQPGRYSGKNTIATADGWVQDNPKHEGYQGDMFRVKAMVLALQMFSQDNNDQLPKGPTWMDDLKPYLRSERYFHSPALKSYQYGYAFNSAIARHSIINISDPHNTLAIFDSTILTRNAVSTSATLPVPGRYFGQNVRGFVDGTVR